MNSTSPFFRLLSEDLQVHVFQAWFEEAACSGPALKVLSSLDVACSNHSLRQPFLLLVSTLRLKGRATNMKYNKDMSCFMRWLSDRGVAVSSLHIPILVDSNKTGGMLTRVKSFLGFRSPSHRKQIVLPYVTQLSLGHLGGTLSVAAFNMALAACPNATSIEFCNIDMDNVIWRFLASTKMKVKAIKVFSVRYDGLLLYTTEISPMLRNIGPTLEELTLNWIVAVDEHFMSSLGMYCKRLQRLEVALSPFSIELFVDAVNACPLLRDIHIIGFQGSVEDISTIIEAGSLHQLKRFCISGWTGDWATITTEFVTLLDRHRWLESLKLNVFWSLKRTQHTTHSTSSLNMVTQGLDLLIAQRVLDACPDLTKFTVCCGLQSSSSLPALNYIATSSSLVDVTLLCNQMTHHQEIVFPLHCAALKRFSTSNVHIGDEVLVKIAQACRRLEHVQLIARQGRILAFGDTGVIALFENCPKLKSISIGCAPACTKRCLEAILNNELLLVSMTLHVMVSFGKVEMDVFNERAKELELLPLPSVKWLVNNDPDYYP